MPKPGIIAAILILLPVLACSQRVQSEEEYASNERERPLLPSSAAPPALVTGSGAQPMGGSPGPAAPEAASAEGEGVSGTVEAPGLGTPPVGAVLFVFVRAAGQTGGPPLAVRRMTPRAFPLDFEIGPQDAMMARGPFPDQVTVEARLDGDGDPLSRSPGDRSAASGPVPPGTTGIVLRLAPGE